MSKVLIVDDDIDIAELISLILKKEQIESDIITEPKEVIKQIEKENYDLILLDIMMPELSGTELCSEIRKKYNTPIIFVSAKKELVDKMLGYEIGGDDYITKPFDNIELVLKIKSYLRMNKRVKNIEDNIIRIGEITLNEETEVVTKNGHIVALSTREYELLKYLMKNSGITLSKEQIFENVWGYEYGDIGTVAVNIKNLRHKIEDKHKYIITVWGYGYKFVRDVSNG